MPFNNSWRNGREKKRERGKKIVRGEEYRLRIKKKMNAKIDDGLTSITRYEVIPSDLLIYDPPCFRPS